jgi:hypothetical protein
MPFGPGSTGGGWGLRCALSATIFQFIYEVNNSLMKFNQGYPLIYWHAGVIFDFYKLPMNDNIDI